MEKFLMICGILFLSQFAIIALLAAIGIGLNITKFHYNKLSNRFIEKFSEEIQKGNIQLGAVNEEAVNEKIKNSK